MSKLRDPQGPDASHISLPRDGIWDEGVTCTALFKYPIQLNVGYSEIQVPIKGALNLGGDDLVLFKTRDDVG